MNNDFLWKEFYLDKIDPSWVPFFQQEAQKVYFFPLLAKLSQEYQNYKCWPRKENIFRLFREISVHQIKVVILGQDPYYLPEVADGLAFSTQRPNYIPASLNNIFLEFSRDLNCSQPLNGNLLPWVKEGIFLLNTALTVKEWKAAAHMDWWKEFVYSLITYLKNYEEKLIWILWGTPAQQIAKKCQINENRKVVGVHPSPRSADRGFFGTRPFSKTNQLLSESGKEPVNWFSILSPKLEK
ncbi:uracil-DNA glycosylase [endosymbiont DhMRE of Dentiscutata heterogama]|uniref:uracil-DNA glycosylase n=1 Tax=endosymbiont DhMRE of Dentiscutata heterogama TaxID=1609546 RepID=UPI002AD317AF|nr:uracil-DNA glycosylase [endosymbiont DhMRE of Dentiscutata heterogama]